MAALHNRYLITSIMLLAFTLRIWGIADIPTYSGDESYHVPALKTYIETGHSAEWIHPPMKYFLLLGSMKLFGDNPYGWRMKNVIFGTLTVLAIYLLAGALFKDPGIAHVAALLFAVDPLHIVVSRSTYGEIPTVFFLILCVYVTVRYVKGEISSPLLAGVFFGLVLADRWYYLFALVVLVSYVIYHKFRSTGWLGLVHVLSIYVALPFAIYVASFALWFGRGHTLGEFFPMQVDMYRELQSLSLESFQSQFAQFLPSSPWAWFVKPQIAVLPFLQQDSWGRFFVIMNNPLTWFPVLPAIAYLAYVGVRQKDHSAVLVCALFAASYFQFILVKRPIFIYSALTVLPFAFLAVASSLQHLLRALPARTARSSTRAVLVVVLLWGLYLYPFVTVKNVPVPFYEPLLATGSVLQP